VRAGLVAVVFGLVVVAGVVVAVVVGGGSGDGPSAEPFEGAWDVSLVVGAVDADPGADPASFPGDATFRERWVFEDCDDDSCTLRRPDGGLLLGDLDEVPFTFQSLRGVDDVERFAGEGTGAELPPPVESDEPPEPCVGTPAREWTVQIEVSVADRVLSGTVLRAPDARQLEVEGTTCYGLDLTLGFSGVPAASGSATPSG
jgi:hypothetical protein